MSAPSENLSPPEVPDHELIRMIGRGSYGEVWLARNIMGTWRAVKLVRRATFDSDRPYEREFAGIRRSEPVSRSHEGMVDILHMGRRTEEGFFYYVMELADSTGASPEEDPARYRPLTLSARLEERKPLPAEDCLRLVNTVAGVLAHLHEFGLIHRDVKPSNILYFSDVPKLGDIGLVAEANSSRSFVGTEGYVPPEGPGTERSDIYGLGKTLYEALTGQDRSRYPEVPADWAQHNDFPRYLELNEIVLRACEPKAVNRYHTAREMLADAALIATGKSLKRLRGIERGWNALRIAMIAVSTVALVAGGAFLWQQREAELARAQLARSKSEHAMEEARRDARLARWYGLTARAQAARHDISAGAVTSGLQAAREAAADQPSRDLRDAAAFLLGRPDAVPLPAGRVESQGGLVELNLARRQCLRLNYRPETPPEKRVSPVAELVPLDGGPALPLPEDFVRTHTTGLTFTDGGATLTDKTGKRWTLPGPVLNASATTSASAGENKRESPDGQWSARLEPNENGEHAFHILHRGQPGPVLTERQRGGGTGAAFLEPGHFLATTSWRGITWIEDLLQGTPALRIPEAGEALAYEPSQHLLGFAPYGGGLARAFEWRPSPVLHHFHPEAPLPMVCLFSPDERWMVLSGEGGRTVLYGLDPLQLSEPALTTEGSTAWGAFSKRGTETVLTWFGNGTEQILTSDGPKPALSSPQPADFAQKDSTLLRDARLEAAVISSDASVVALGAAGPVAVWRKGVLEREFVLTGRECHLRDPATGTWQPPLPAGATGDFVRLSLSADGRFLAIGGFHSGKLWIWDLSAARDRKALRHQEQFASCPITSFSPDGRWLASNGGDATRVLDTATWKTVASWPREIRHSGHVGWSADSRLFFTQQAREDIVLIRSGTWEELVRLQPPGHDVLTHVVLSPSSRWLAAAGGFDGHEWLWDLHALQRELKAHGLGWE